MHSIIPCLARRIHAVDDGSFGTISYTSNTPREMQLALKFNF